MVESDSMLVERTLAGDLTAADVLLRRHFRACFLIALSAVGEHAEAEDVCQEAFVNALSRLHQCREPQYFSAWLATIVRNTGHNKRRYLDLRHTEQLADHAGMPSGVQSERVAERAELRDRLNSALRQLPTIQREVVLLHDLEGMRHREIAMRLGVSEVMSRRHLSDARAILRRLLGDYQTLSPDHD